MRLARDWYHAPPWLVGEMLTSHELSESIAFLLGEAEEQRIDYMSNDELVKEYQRREFKLKQDGLDPADDYMFGYLKRTIVKRGAAKIEEPESADDDDEPPSQSDDD